MHISTDVGSLLFGFSLFFLAEAISLQKVLGCSLLMIGVFYLVLGLFMEGLSICVMSLPITLPLIIAAGYDPIWFGIFLVITVELAQVTPPVGFNLFVLQALSGKPIERVAVAAFPFFLLLASTAVILVIFPQIALWLPDILY